MPRIGIILGSKSDLPVIKAALEVCKKFGVEADLHISSAHRNAEDTAHLVEGAGKAGWEVIIAAAGMAAHLAGTVAARTVMPVIGIPLAGGVDGGLDALLSTAQMPRGVPVACVAVGEAGAHNAALLAVRILAVKYPELGRKLESYRRELRDRVRKADRGQAKGKRRGKK